METLPAAHTEAAKTIKAMPAPEKGDRYAKSPNVKGLVLRVSASGSRSWQVRYFVKVGEEWRSRKTTIGRFKEKAGGAGLTVKEAEREAESIKTRARDGVDPVGKRKAEAEQKAEAERKARQAELGRTTMQDLHDRWLVGHLQRPAGGHKDGGAEASRWIRSKILPKFADLEVSEFRRAHFFEVVDPMLEAGQRRGANVLLSLTKHMLGFAVDREMIDRNPLESVTKRQVGGVDSERDRVLCAYEDPDTHELVEDELADLFAKMPESGLSDTSQAAIHICLATCCRIGELLKARWPDVDLAAAEWRIPEANSKNGKPHLVNLSPYAAEYFARLHDITGGGEWIYPAARGGGPVDPKAITRQIADRQKPGEGHAKRSKKHDALILPRGRWTPHDLRRTGATIMAGQGVMGAVVERCLNHAEPSKVKRIYNRHSPREQMIEAWELLGSELQRLSKIEAMPAAERWQSGKLASIHSRRETAAG